MLVVSFPLVGILPPATEEYFSPLPDGRFKAVSPSPRSGSEQSQGSVECQGIGIGKTLQLRQRFQGQEVRWPHHVPHLHPHLTFNVH